MATQRVTKREFCSTHQLEFGQEKIFGVPGKTSDFWYPPVCRRCEEQLLREEKAAEQVASQTAEITAEAERRIAADSEYDEKIRERANADLMADATKMLATFCALHREEWENFHRDSLWNEIIGQVELEKKAEFLERLKGA